MQVINLSEQNSVLNNFLKELRDVGIQKDSMRFRRNLERIGEIMAYEISKTFSYQAENVQTPLGISPTNIFTNQVVLSTVLRAGLPFHQGFFNYFGWKAPPIFIPKRLHSFLSHNIFKSHH